jgi:DNA-binding transcriptional LysR family regulator
VLLSVGYAYSLKCFISDHRPDVINAPASRRSRQRTVAIDTPIRCVPTVQRAMNLSLRQLKVFLGVAESSSFTKTAQRLHLSQAALSAIIRELESQLQCRLLDRTTRTVALTEAGRVFVQTASHIVHVLENSAVELARIARAERRVLRIGVTPHIAVSMIPALLKRFALAHPEVGVEVTDTPPEELLRLVESGHLDAAYGAFFDKTSGIDRDPILDTHLVRVAPLEDACTWTEPDTDSINWTSLQDVPLLCLHKDNPIQRLVDEHLARECVAPSRRTVVSHLETAISMAEAGFGVAIMPSLSKATCQRYRVRVEPIEPLVELAFYCITQAGRGQLELVRQFSDVFVEAAAQFEEQAAAAAKRDARKKKDRPRPPPPA